MSTSNSRGNQFLDTIGDHVEIIGYDVDCYWFKWDLKQNKVQLIDKTGAKRRPPFPLSLVVPALDEPPSRISDCVIWNADRI